MPKILFQRAKKGKVAPHQNEHEPDGDTPAQEREEGNTSAPGPKTTQKGIKVRSLKKATSEEDAAGETTAFGDDKVEQSNVKATGSDKGKVAKKVMNDGPDGDDDPPPATPKPKSPKGPRRFGRSGSPIRF